MPIDNRYVEHVYNFIELDTIICEDKLCTPNEEIEIVEFITDIEIKLTEGIKDIRASHPKYVTECVAFGYCCCPFTLGISTFCMLGYMFSINYNKVKTEIKQLHEHITQFIALENEKWMTKGLKWTGIWNGQISNTMYLYDHNDIKRIFKLKLEVVQINSPQFIL